jgi:integration host factor subunit beta
MRTVTKKELSKHLAELLDEKAYITGKIWDSIFSSLRDIMTESDGEVRIEIRDFGVFEVKKTKPKSRARNPRTGETVYVPARKKVHFRAGKFLKQVLRKPLNTR